jgi:hypothetical protein
MCGIEPIIAVVILVAVTLVVAIGVISWLMGWWGSMGATESLQIYPDSYIEVGNPNKLYLHIKNTGTATAVIFKVEIVGVGTVEPGDTPLTPGQEDTLQLQFSNTVTPGVNYQVKVYTKSGGVYPTVVKAK